MLRIGLVSDTHGMARPQVLQWLRGSDHIIHAGDIVKPDILQELAAMAPLTVVRGNNDHGDWAERIAHTATVRIGEVRLHVVHDIADLELPEDVQAVVTGHSHQPKMETRGGVLYVNPGSAGPRRFRLPIAAGELLVEGRSVSARIMQFEA